MSENLTRLQEKQFKVAVFWPREGSYGGASLFSALDDALRAAKRLCEQGYENRPTSEVHIMEVVSWRYSIFPREANEREG